MPFLTARPGRATRRAPTRTFRHAMSPSDSWRLSWLNLDI